MFEKLYAWYGRRTVWTVAAVILTLLVIGVVIKLASNGEEEAPEVLPVVEVASVAELGGAESITLLGTVRSVSEANIESEAAGRVTGVRVSLGDTVSAGTVIATLENASERAAVLQAEGAYEAAQANASVGDISVAQAQTALQSAKDSAINTLQSSYATVSNTFFSVIDDYYNNPNSPLTAPKLFTDNRSFLSSERVAFQTVLPTWQQQVSTLSSQSDLSAEITYSIEQTIRARVLVDQFLGILQTRDSDTFNAQSIPTLISELNGTRTTLSNTITALESARSTLTGAEDSLAQAELGGTNTDLSAANAQVKQALGSLRAAQANLAKTIITSPIAGTVNNLDVNVGDFIGSFVPVAKVANNDALEVTVFVGDADRNALTVGDEVLIEGEYVGTITNIGAGIDADTQKTEVKIATETNQLTNGDSVSVALVENGDDNGEITTMMLPITAVKFTAEAGSVLTVEDGTIVEHPVELGVVRGGFVEIVGGVTTDMEVIVDARGLTSGSKVEVN